METMSNKDQHTVQLGFELKFVDVVGHRFISVHDRLTKFDF